MTKKAPKFPLIVSIRLIIMVIVTIGFFTFATPFAWNIINAGNIFGAFFCAFVFLVALFWDLILKLIKKYKWAKIISMIITAFIGIGFLTAIVLSVFMLNALSPHIDPPKTVIVLGAGLWGENPSPMLAERLDSAIEFMNQYPDSICIVSGGQGDNEVIPEALAMYNYMVNKGADKERIFQEDRSRNTFENIAFSKTILEEKGYTSLDIAIATDPYHQFRAGMVAKKAGYEQIFPINANTNLTLIPTYWVREWFGILKYTFFNQM